MKIKQLLIQPHGQKIGGMTLTVKTCKKTWQVGDVWWQQVLFMDGTGEIPADIKIGKFSPLHRAWDVRIIVAEVREAEYLGKSRKILVVDQYEVQTQSFDDGFEEADKIYQGELKVVRSKIKCLLACHNGPKASPAKLLSYITNDNINKVVDKIMEG